jgi:hypothetical protein
MQCSSCGFENIPGSEACGRCGSSMRVGTMVMDVNPPRAGKFRKKLRNAVPVRRAFYGARDEVQSSSIAAASTRAASVARRSVGELPPFPITWRLLVPGWSHFYLGQTWRGRLFLWGFLALLIPGMLLMGATSGSVLLGLAFSVHTSAAFDIINQRAGPRGFAAMMLGSIVVTIVLAVIVYLPVAMLLSQFASPRVLQADAGMLTRGDVVWINPSWHRGDWLKPGTVVLYQLPAQRRENWAGHAHVFYIIEGERIDRIIGAGGDRVTWENNALLINGFISPLRPLQTSAMPKKFSFTVPTNCVLILPSTTPNLRPNDPGLWEELACVPRENVIGNAYLRTQPLYAMKIIR